MRIDNNTNKVIFSNDDLQTIKNTMSLLEEMRRILPDCSYYAFGIDEGFEGDNFTEMLEDLKLLSRVKKVEKL